MVRLPVGVAGVIITMILSSFIHFENAVGVAFNLTRFQLIGGIVGIGFLFMFREKSTKPLQ